MDDKTDKQHQINKLVQNLNNQAVERCQRCEDRREEERRGGEEKRGDEGRGGEEIEERKGEMREEERQH